MSNPVVQKPLLTADELSAETGLATPQIYRWTEGVFPSEFILKVGRRRYYRRALINWLAGELDGTQSPEAKP
jgi:predicted DNA-binding transcriptional regulator AlpA